ncbi:MAG TPA: DUF962 domain-containing protein [Blastocatellia bacterium]|nr:DUF962 domain-containing protein [Blastocatellia bacterium]
MAETNSITNFREFWPYYVAAHSRSMTRIIHLIATLSSWIIIAFAVTTGYWWYLLSVPFVAYALAWYSHFFIEHNRPATFGHPFYSLAADYKMAALMLTGQMSREIERLNQSQTEQNYFAANRQ